ncbi:hypothetical protein Scep_030850 [Stephania cephalantha]|uniref:Uncharacterized protein n=1 Tax=Stephania cephalantha TaxID=152367 RepID=A0AAP0E0F5_9MAGN
MGANSVQSLLLSLDLKDMVLGNKGTPSNYGSLWNKVLAAQSLKRRQERKQKGKKKALQGHNTWNSVITNSQSRRTILMKRPSTRPSYPEGSRRNVSGVHGRVRALKKLVPNGKSMGFDGLLMDTAQYIMSLEMQVKVMKIMVNVLSSEGSSGN